MGFPGSRDYRRIPTEQLEAMLQPSTPPAEYLAILQELDRRHTSRHRAAGSFDVGETSPGPGTGPGPLRQDPFAPGYPEGPPGTYAAPDPPPWINPAIPDRPRFASFNWLAPVSLIVALLWMYGFGSVAAVVIGLIACKQIKQRGQRGRSLAVAGILMGGMGALVLGLVVLSSLGGD